MHNVLAMTMLAYGSSWDVALEQVSQSPPLPWRELGLRSYPYLHEIK